MNFKNLYKILFPVLFAYIFNGCSESPLQTDIVGNKDFVHLEKTDSIWWLVDGNGEKFISTGMNHMQENIRFAPYNTEYWAERFGQNILIDGYFNSNAQAEIKMWMEQTVKDHKDYGFTTIPFHRSLNLPDEYLRLSRKLCI